MNIDHTQHISPSSPPNKKNNEKIPEKTNNLNGLVDSIAKKELHEITSEEVKELKSLLKKIEKDNPDLLGTKKLSVAVKKILQRESKSLNNSILQKSINRHKKNLKFFTYFAAAHKEVFSQYVTDLNKKPINQLERHEIEPFMAILDLRNGNSLSPTDKRVDKLVGKILEREKMALSHSYLPNSTNRHDKNIDYNEEWMLKNDSFGASAYIKLDELSKKLDALSKSLTDKVIDKITNEEVNEFINLATKWYNLCNSIAEAKEQKYLSNWTPSGDIVEDIFRKFKVREDVANEMKVTPKSQTLRQIAYTKVLLREEMSLDRSFFESSKDRHKTNIETLKKMMPGEREETEL